MKEVGIRELKAHSSEIVRQVAENHATYTVTRRGKALAVLSPAGREPTPPGERDEEAWERFERLADALGGIRRTRKSALRELTAMRR